MTFFFIIFLLIFLSLTGGTHYLVYRTGINALAIKSLRARLISAIVFALLGISFIAGMFLARSQSGLAAQLVYWIGALWYGLLVNLFWAALAFRLWEYFNKRYGLDRRRPMILAIFIGLALAVTAYGSWAARFPVIKEIAVKLDGLPAHWTGKTAVLISDTHLGPIYTPAWMERLVERINRLEPDLIFVSGDYFDGSFSNFRELAAPLGRLRAKYPIYFAPGNHEFYRGYENIENILAENNIRFMRNEIDRINGLAVIGADYVAHGQPHDLDGLLSELAPDEASILIQHEPRILPETLERGVGLQLSGHSHLGQFWPFNLATRLIYGRYHYGLHQKDGLKIYTTSGAGTWGPPLRFPRRGEIVRITLE